MRTVKINNANIPSNEATRQAIGYLSLWATQLYDVVTISGKYLGPDASLLVPDLIAYYKNSATGQEYTIGAVGDAKTNTYSFHS